MWSGHCGAGQVPIFLAVLLYFLCSFGILSVCNIDRLPYRMHGLLTIDDSEESHSKNGHSSDTNCMLADSQHQVAACWQQQQCDFLDPKHWKYTQTMTLQE